jgi:hypothetical protein
MLQLSKYNHPNFVETASLRKNIHRLLPDDIVAITGKFNGTSFAVGKLLVNKKLNWKQRFFKTLGADIIEVEYDTVVSFRKVQKNEFDTTNHNHDFKNNLGNDIKEELKDSILNGITLYGEAVGYLNDGAFIQSGYDYGCPWGKFQAYIYRITQTNVDGKVIELSWPQIVDYCEKFGLTTVPEIYYGRLKDYIPVDGRFRLDTYQAEVLSTLEEKFLEGDCKFCMNNVPAEGIVLRKEKAFDFEAFKLKSFRFLEKESKDLDNNVVDIETQQSLELAS